MTDLVYWRAPLWEVAVAALAVAAAVGWLLVEARRRGGPGQALARVEPALDRQPFFYFDAVRGVSALNEGGRRLLVDLAAAAAEAEEPDHTLIEVLLGAYEQARIRQREGWPGPGETLLAVPVAGPGDDVVGVVAFVASNVMTPPLTQLAVEHDPAAESWLVLGPSLRLHRQRPIAEVLPVAADRNGGWQGRQLAHTEEALLRQLVTRPGEVQAAEALFRLVWPDEPVSRHGLRPDQRDRLRRLVFQLRQHIEPEPGQPRYVCTAHGVGYVFYADGAARDA